MIDLPQKTSPEPTLDSSTFDSSPPELELRADKQYHLAELLRYDGREFVRAAYRAVLLREPDEDGLTHHLNDLRLGRLSKTDVIENLRRSAEGERHAVKIKGLKPPIVRRLRHVPYLGYLIRWVKALFYLPDLLRAHEVGPQANEAQAFSLSGQKLMQNFVAYRTEIGDELKELKELVTDASDAVTMLTESVAGLIHLRDEQPAVRALEEGLGVVRQSIAQAEADLARITAEILNWQKSQDALFQEQRSNAAFFQELLIQEQRVIVDTQKAGQKALLDRVEDLRREQRQLEMEFRLAEGRTREPASAPQPAPVLLDHRYDGLLAAFEGHFRGAPDEVRERLSYYLPHLKEATECAIGGREAPILDLGCGRGEWLALLGENGMTARGVDSNSILVAACREAGLDVIEGDVVSALAALPDASLGAVTGFHVIEHLPFGALIELLDQTARVLRPGGLAIFETPNPKNLVVAACNFWSDPTHVRPIYPETIHFLMSHRGLADVRLEYLHPVETNLFENARGADGRALDTWFNWFYGHRDYAAIGRKI